MPEPFSATSHHDRHRPERYYGECRTCVAPDALPEALPDALEALAADYESDYYDTHFGVGEDSLTACERSFDGWGCPGCADEQEQDFVEWEKCPHYDPTRPLPDARWDQPPSLPEGLMVDA